MWLESWNKYEQQQVQVEQKETSLEQKLDFLSDATWNKRDYENFIKFLETIQDKAKKEKLINFLEDSKNNKEKNEQIMGNIFTFWFPWLDQAINDFFEVFWIKVNETEEKVNETEEKVNVRLKLYNETKEEYLNKYLKLLQQVNWTEKFINLLKLDNPTTKDLKEIHQFLKQNWQSLFKQIANSPNLTLEERKELFDTTRNFVGANFPDIHIPDFDYFTKWTWDDTITNSTKILEDVDWNLSNNTVQLDLDHIPPKYDLGRIDSKYKFTNKLDSDEVSDLTWEYLDEVKNIQDSFKFLGKVGKWYSNFKKSIQKLWQENTKDIQKWNFTNFKEGLQANLNSFRLQSIQNLWNIYKNIDIPANLKLTSADITKIWNIENPNDLQQKFENFEERYKKLQIYLQNKPKKIYDNYKNKLKQKVIEDTQDTKEKQKKILEFLHSIGFDLIPQNYTDKLINIINTSETLKSKFGFDRKIDLANWELWINKDADMQNNSIYEKKIFAQFVNKMISWNKKYPIDVNSMSHWVPIFKNKSWETILNKQAYVNKKLSLGFSSIWENLNKNEKEK